MKTLFKLTAATVALAALAVAVALTSSPATAQPRPGSSILNPSRVTGGGVFTNRIAGSTALTMGTSTSAKIDVSQSRYLCVGVQGNLVGAGTTTFALWLSRNAEGGTNREAAGILTLTANGTAPVYATTNIDVGGYHSYYLEVLTNASGTGSSYLTNWIITAYPK